MGLVRQLALPSAETVEKMSYGDPLFRMPTQSNIPITTDRGYLAEVLGLAPAASAASRATTRLSNEAADALVRQITGNQQATAQGALQAAGEMAPLARMFKPEQVKSVLPETKVVDEQGNPQLMYHGTPESFEDFEAGRLGAVFASPDPKFASKYAGEEYTVDVMGGTPNVRPVYIDAKNPFDYENPKHISAVVKWVKENNPDFQDVAESIGDKVKDGFYYQIERPIVQDAIRSLGFDGFYVKEGGAKNIAVFNPNQIKSATSDPAFTGLLEPQAGARPMFETGREVTFPFIKNTEKAPKTTGFAQEIEPAGNYILSGEDVDVAKLPQGWTSGEVTFKNPLVLDWGKSGLYSEPDNWKQVLSSQYGGKTGKALSRAIAKDGYDGIVTINEYGPSEIVDLTMFAKK